MTKSKTIFISNRLPFSIKPKTGQLQRGSGGLVSALLGVRLDEPFYWLGFETDPELAEQLRRKSPQVNENLRLHPVVLEKKLYDSYYDRFCNDVLWPLFHYEGQHVFFRKDDWASYERANRQMADEILNIAGPKDTVWIHDFHFMLLPEMLKKENPSLKVGFFLHTPFPSSEIIRQLPVREQIMRAMTRCDLIGFHEHSYLRHFSVSLKAILGVDSSIFKADLGDHTLHLGVYPISIDTEEMKAKAASPAVTDLVEKFRDRIRSKFLILGVDRLDYSKGLELKLKGFRRMLQKYPELRGQVSLLQVAVPTRTKVPSYIRLKKEIDQLVGTINGEFGQPGYTPVNYIFNSVSENELLALYRRSECVLITSKRDGMNLVAMEYAVCQAMETPGSIVLSEFVGAASVLGQAVFINPWDEDSIADALFQVYHMPLDEKQERLQGLHDILSKYSATQWARSFLHDLESGRRERRKYPTLTLRPEHLDVYTEVFEPLRRAAKRTLILDYDGTLVSLQKRPEAAVIPESYRQLLRGMRRDFAVYIVSGRSRQFLDEQFPAGDFHLVAEHGAYYREPGGEWQNRISSDISSWFSEAKRVMCEYTERVPLSFVEVKDAALVWHFRQSPGDFAEYQSRKLDDELQTCLANQPVSVTMGSKIIEAKAVECNKGNFVRWLKETSDKDQVYVCIGDDRTDEDMFRVFDGDGLTIKVGPDATAAHYRVPHQQDVEKILRYLLRSSAPDQAGKP